MRDLNALTGSELGGWKLSTLLGRGAMGAVFEGARGDERAAIKVMLAGEDASENQRKRFEREAKAVAQIQGEHVCGCLGHGAEDGLQWLALEFIAGRDLMEVLKLRRALPLLEALDYARQILVGLEQAHAAGVVHRDLKPANAILTGEGKVKLVDFGLARRQDESMLLTAEGAIMGTPYYMSPEQVEGKVVDPRADLYALGHMIYHFLCGKPAFTGRTATQILAAHVTRTLPSVRDACPDAPLALDRFLARLASPEREERYADASSALEALDRILAREGRAKAAAKRTSARRAQPRESPRTDSLGHAEAKRTQEEERAREGRLQEGREREQARAAAEGAKTVSQAGPGGGQPTRHALATPPIEAPPFQLQLGAALVLALGSYALAPLLGLDAPGTRAITGLVGAALGWFLATSWHQQRTNAARRSSVAALNAGAAAPPQSAPASATALAAPGPRQLEEAGDLVGAATAHRARGEHERAAELLERAGRWSDAAKARQELGDFMAAAGLLERAGDAPGAARLLSERAAALEARRKNEQRPRRRARLDEELALVIERASALYAQEGSPRDGARLLARIGRHRDAAELYLEAGDREEASQQWIKAGDRERAAELYERAGDVVAAARLSAPELLRKGDKAGAARALEQAGDLEQAARYFEEAGQLERAAELSERAGQRVRAAELFERAGKTLRAAQLFQREGESYRAGRAYEQADMPARALECYRDVGEEGADWAQSVRRIARLEEVVRRAPKGDRVARGPGRAASGRAGSNRPKSERSPGRPATKLADRGAKGPRRWVGEVIDRYRVVDVLGSGAFADVLRAEHVHLERPVALKILRPDVAARADVCERFLAEAKIVSRIRHPGVVEVFDFGRTEAGDPFMALELVKGRTLRAVAQEGPQPVERVRAWGVALSEALGAAHGAGVVHRDLKPENVIVDRERAPHVLDFGMARVFWGTDRDAQAGFLGTPRYASPEAAAGEDVAAPADQYALALILYELASGRLPFESNSPTGWLHHHAHTTPPSPREFRADLPQPFCEALLQALAKPPQARHADLAAFGRALRA